MTTSNTYTFDPALNDVLDEAFEMAGMDPGAIGSRHIQSAFRSLRLMLNSEWSTIGVRQWQVPRNTQNMTSVGMAYFDLPAGGLDVLGAVLRRNNRDTEMYPMSRNEWLTLVDKTLKGRPDRYFVDRIAGRPRCYFWRLAENTTDQIIYDCFTQIQDVGDQELQLTLQLPAYAHDAMTYGLAARLALKFNVQKYPLLNTEYRGADPNRIGGKLDALRQESRERSDIELYAKYEPRTSLR